MSRHESDIPSDCWVGESISDDGCIRNLIVFVIVVLQLSSFYGHASIGGHDTIDHLEPSAKRGWHGCPVGNDVGPIFLEKLRRTNMSHHRLAIAWVFLGKNILMVIECTMA